MILERGLGALALLRKGQVRSYWFQDRTNLGDLLGPAILGLAFGLTAVHVPARARRKVLTVGSILQHARPGDIVWGAGLNVPRLVDVRRVDVRCVRGPHSHAWLRGDAPEVFGDPASLLPILYTPRTGNRCEVGVIPHYVDQRAVYVEDPSVRMIDVTSSDWRTTINRIASCDVIVSSSLHGLIVAEAYGIASVWMQATHDITGGRFKFDDYYAATRREVAGPSPWADGLAAAVSAAEAPPDMDWNPLLDAWLQSE